MPEGAASPAAVPPPLPQRGLGVAALRDRLLPAALLVSWVLVAVPALWAGWDYYRLPLIERPYAETHELFRPAGLVGNRLAILGTGLIAFGVTSYIVRKRWRRLERLGRLRTWLSFHIWCCTLGPFLILLHSAFRVGGLVSIAFWAIVAVVLSGLLGRYVYVRIPRALDGRARSLREVEASLHATLESLSERLDAAELALIRPPRPSYPTGVLGALAHSARADREVRQSVRHLRTRLAARGVPRTERRAVLAAARTYARQSRRQALLVPLDRLFQYWHTFHLPLALVMALVVVLHIAVAIAFGVAWAS